MKKVFYPFTEQPKAEFKTKDDDWLIEENFLNLWGYLRRRYPNVDLEDKKFNDLIELKTSLEGDDSAKIASDLEALTQEAMKLGEAIYKAQEDTQNNETESPEPEDSTIVDADFEEVDEDKNT